MQLITARSSSDDNIGRNNCITFIFCDITGPKTEKTSVSLAAGWDNGKIASRYIAGTIPDLESTF